MEVNRAREIIKAEETIRVLHNGVPVWIESLNGGTALVKPLGRARGTVEVPVADLVEG